MSEEEIIRICKLICGTKNKNGKREYKTIERMNLLRDYNEDTLEEAIQGILDLYNKEKEKNKEYEKLHLTEYKLEPDGNLLSKIIELDDYIHKDKIIDILNLSKDEDTSIEKILSLLETLMSEVDRLEDIEDKKVQVEVQNIERKRDKYWENKIKEKIKKLEKEIHVVTSDTHIIEKINEFKNEGALNILQELLEEGE